MSQPYDVSIIIPAYNPDLSALQYTLASINAQRCPYRIEIIVVDDGSVPPVPPLLHPWMKLLHVEHGGVSHARNEGILYSAADAILCIDVGDLVSPNFLSATMPLLRKPDHLIYTNTALRRRMGKVDYFNWGEYDFERLKKFNYITITSLFAREMFDAIRAKNGEGFDTKVEGYEDWLFWLESGYLGFKGTHVPEPLFTYIEHPNSRNAAADERMDSIMTYMHAKLVKQFGEGLWAM